MTKKVLTIRGSNLKSLFFRFFISIFFVLNLHLNVELSAELRKFDRNTPISDLIAAAKESTSISRCKPRKRGEAFFLRFDQWLSWYPGCSKKKN